MKGRVCAERMCFWSADTEVKADSHCVQAKSGGFEGCEVGGDMDVPAWTLGFDCEDVRLVIFAGVVS